MEQEQKKQQENKETVEQDLNQTEEQQIDEKENEHPCKEEKHKHKFDITKEQKYIELVEENAKLKDQLLRKQAEFENFRKRTNEDRIKERKYALYDFLLDSIECLDIFDKAVSVKTDDEKLKKYLSGFVMINNRLKNILSNNGVEQIDCLNKPFDPSTMSALETVEVENTEPETVIEVVMTGYMYKDRVLRPAMVKVSK